MLVIAREIQTDYLLFNSALIKAFTRVIIIMSIGVLQRVLIDGFITHYQFNPSESPGTSTLSVTGEDYSIIMDMTELAVSHPAQPDIVIVGKLIVRYGLIPVVIPPLHLIAPEPTRKIPQQDQYEILNTSRNLPESTIIYFTLNRQMFQELI